MGIRFKSAGALSAATAAVLFTALAGPAVAATGPTSAAALPLTGFSSIVADSAHHQVFVSGAGSDPVAVADFAGRPVSTLSSLDGATALALSRGDGILYAAIGGTDEIAAVNTSTLQEVALYFTGTGHDARHLAVVGHDVWFSYGASGQSGIGVLDPTALTVATTAESTFYNAPVLAASPSAPNVLVAGDGGMSPSVIESFDVSTGAPVPVAKSDPWSQSDGCENLSQLAVTADGADVVSACGAPYHGSELTLSGMSENATYQTGAYPGSVAVAPANGTIAFGTYATSPSVYLFRPGTSNPTGTYQLSGFGVYGLAWNQSGSELFAVSTPSTPSSSTPTLNVISIS
ncbi:hypothetical protein ABH926_004644 [Catenulispora sp. GP43]|uniref:YncE family protein n=1 Tax=Catenulispora sp. GP43 TaxID=3156263 RepID=UPI003514AF7C